MNATSDLPPSKGMKMVATYRAERLNQRPILRTNLHQSHVARRAARMNTRAFTEPSDAAQAEISPSVPAAGEDATSVFAGLVSTAVVEQQTEAGHWQGMQAELARTASAPIAQSEAAATPPTETAREDRPQRVDESTAEQPPAAPREVMRPEPAAPSTQASPPAADVAPVQPSAYDPPLAEIGFGPGMLIRLSQLGLYTTSDLAQADAFELRSALGDISRLVDVDAWIRSARQTIGSTASKVAPRTASQAAGVSV